jgi:hypothetical protein
VQAGAFRQSAELFRRVRKTVLNLSIVPAASGKPMFAIQLKRDCPLAKTMTVSMGTEPPFSMLP